MRGSEVWVEGAGTLIAWLCVGVCAQASTLDEMLKLGLGTHLTAIEETCVNAQKEYSLEKALDRMQVGYPHSRRPSLLWGLSRALTGSPCFAACRRTGSPWCWS
jgi:hypothetical protein